MFRLEGPKGLRGRDVKGLYNIALIAVVTGLVLVDFRTVVCLVHIWLVEIQAWKIGVLRIRHFRKGRLPGGGAGATKRNPTRVLDPAKGEAKKVEGSKPANPKPSRQTENVNSPLQHSDQKAGSRYKTD